MAKEALSTNGEPVSSPCGSPYREPATTDNGNSRRIDYRALWSALLTWHIDISMICHRLCQAPFQIAIP